MREVYGDIWTLARNAIICISTNGSFNRQGEAVMGRGLALEAKQRYPKLPETLGHCLRIWGNSVHVFEVLDPINYHWIVTLPVKHQWHERANLELIGTSLQDLIDESYAAPSGMLIYLTRLGCFNGGRDWETEVKPIMQEILTDDRFIVVERQ